MTPTQGKSIFSLLDSNDDDRIGYTEFCQLAVEEQRIQLLEDIRSKRVVIKDSFFFGNNGSSEDVF